MASVLIRTESGVDMVHDLPLPEGLAARVEKGECQDLGPCDADGVLVAPDPEPEPKKSPVPPRAALKG